MSSSSSPILESFIQSNYPGINLPPLWHVIYQEAIRGHHLLFRRTDIERYDRDSDFYEFEFDGTLSDEIELVTLKLIGCADLQAMVKIIDHMEDDKRRNLYQVYRRVLWMWRNYVKDQLN